MAFVEMEDPWGTFEVVVFPAPFLRAPREAMQPGEVTDGVVAIAGRVERDGSGIRIVADRIEVVHAADLTRVVSLSERAAAGTTRRGPVPSRDVREAASPRTRGGTPGGRRRVS
jgi:hypothetical protein